MIKVFGLDGLARQLDELAKFSNAIDGDLATVRFDPDDPASVQAAIRQMEAAVDAKAAPYRSNRMVMDLAGKTKAHFREVIRSRKASPASP